jgi:hypothetical protein
MEPLSSRPARRDDTSSGHSTITSKRKLRFRRVSSRLERAALYSSSFVALVGWNLDNPNLAWIPDIEKTLCPRHSSVAKDRA